jgi:hypothetical protein
VVSIHVPFCPNPLRIQERSSNASFDLISIFS